jgi:hypothetical protein
MSNPQPGIIIPADITNPGHFFACCGILELADCLWPGVLGWFDQSTFRIAPALPQRTLSAILRSFSEAPIEELDPDDARASRMRVNIGQRSLLLDWWRKDDPTGGGDLKTWAGQQCGPQIFRALKGSLSKSLESTLARDPLNHAELIFDTGTAGSRGKGKTISAFYFDARRAGTSLDLGFSADEQGMSVYDYPAVESLALVGLQRFRPRPEGADGANSFVYTAWAEPLDVVAAAVAAGGAARVGSFGGYRFSRPSRGGKYVTMFTRAVRERSSNV